MAKIRENPHKGTQGYNTKKFQTKTLRTFKRHPIFCLRHSKNKKQFFKQKKGGTKTQ